LLVTAGANIDSERFVYHRILPAAKSAAGGGVRRRLEPDVDLLSLVALQREVDPPRDVAGGRPLPGDRLLEAALGRLFDSPPDPVEVVKWEKIFELTEKAIDKCEDVAHTLESILVKQA